MQVLLNKLPENVQEYLRHQLESGNCSSVEELITSILVREAEQSSRPKRTPTMGMFADRNVPITFEEIEETSREACQNFPKSISH